MFMFWAQCAFVTHCVLLAVLKTPIRMPPSSWLLAFQNHPKTILKAERTITSTRLKQSTLLFQRGLPLPMNSLHLRLLVPVCGRPPSAPRRLDGVCEAQWRGSSHPRDNSPSSHCAVLPSHCPGGCHLHSVSPFKSLSHFTRDPWTQSWLCKWGLWSDPGFWPLYSPSCWIRQFYKESSFLPELDFELVSSWVIRFPNPLPSGVDSWSQAGTCSRSWADWKVRRRLGGDCE